jgi:hypothetical protein
MAWSAPMTAVAGATFTAAQFNQYVRDNLNAVCTALATAASQIPVSTGANAIAMRTPATASVAASQNTGSATYTNLTTPGPSLTATTGTIAIVLFAVGMANNVSNSLTSTSVAVSGASTIAANDAWSAQLDGNQAGNFSRIPGVHVFTGLTQGSNTFTMMYRVGSNTGSFQNREINVIPL